LFDTIYAFGSIKYAEEPFALHIEETAWLWETPIWRVFVGSLRYFIKNNIFLINYGEPSFLNLLGDLFF